MRDYQRQKNNKYNLPTEVYHQTVWQIRDYDRLKAKAQDILDECAKLSDGQPRGTDIQDIVAQKVIKRDAFIEKTRAIEKALDTIPYEYQNGVWNSILYFERYPRDAAVSTYGSYKSKFIYKTAENLKLI